MTLASVITKVRGPGGRAAALRTLADLRTLPATQGPDDPTALTPSVSAVAIDHRSRHRVRPDSACATVPD
ncbi:MAG: hypothetical protein ACRDLT_10830 [Solirubrobacteraceae bacterium]